MAKNRDDIFQQALALSEADKSALIGELILSLDAEVETGAEEAWRNEIEKRGRELQTGTVQSIPWEVVRERLARAPRG